MSIELKETGRVKRIRGLDCKQFIHPESGSWDLRVGPLSLAERGENQRTPGRCGAGSTSTEFKVAFLSPIVDSARAAADLEPLPPVRTSATLAK